MKIVCLDAKSLGPDANLDILNQFGEFISYDTTPQNLTIERLKDADIVITNKVLITKDVMTNTNLKLICVSATGVNNIDINEAKKLNIPVKNVADYSTNSVVQQTFAGLFTLTNNMRYYSDYVSSGEWTKSDTFTNLDRSIMEINNKNFGIVGLGNIGTKVAIIAQTFGAKVCYFSTSGKNNSTKFKQVSLDTLLKECDIVSIHAPLNENTKNLISQNELDKMKNGAILMNFGRGGIINEKDLAKAIDEKNIKAVLDVLETEPMIKNHPLLSVKNKNNLIITPHIAWGSKEARKILIEKIALNIEEFLKEQN